MGLCASRDGPEQTEEERARSRQIEKVMMGDHRADNEVCKLLLLGAGESGKSTVLKQLVSLWGDGWSEDKRKPWLSVVHQNTVEAMGSILEKYDEWRQEESEHLKDVPPLSDEEQAAKDAIMELRVNAPVDEEVAKNLKLLWQSQAVQSVFAKRNLFQITDSAEYFFSRLDEIGKKDFLPSEQDVLRCRVRTTGIIEKNFAIESSRFLVLDVGGQRNERKKWLHCFDDVTAVLFVAALSGFDQTLYEDEKQNRLTESLSLFEETVKLEYFQHTAIILFLNKSDLLQQKLDAGIDVSKYVDFDVGDGSYQDVVDAIKRQYEKALPKGRMCYTHVTSATERNVMEKVFASVKDTVVRQSLAEGGLV